MEITAYENSRTQTKEEDDTDEFEYQGQRIYTAVQIIKLLKSRLLILKAFSDEQSSNYYRCQDLTKLELGLKESVRSFGKRAVKRQILEIAINKGIQSTLLSITPKNILDTKIALNPFEVKVAQQMKVMMIQANNLSLIRDNLNKMFERMSKIKVEILQHQNFIINNFKIDNLLKKETQDQKLKKKIDIINRMATIINVLIGHPELNLYSEHADLLEYCIKWRKPRTLEYYINLCD